MLIGEARDLLSETFTAQVRRSFIRVVQRPSVVRAVYARRVGARPPRNPAHNPLEVPDVPAAVVRIRRGARGDAAIVFTYKVEYGDPPVPILHVRQNWLTEVVRRDHVVLDGFPVLDVLARDREKRPVEVRVAGIAGYFDASMHGWRAHAHTYEATVDWAGDTPSVVLGEIV